MKDIKDYLHLYLGCEVLIDGETLGTLVGISHTYDVELYVNNQWLHHRFCKLLLRPLSDMTEEEKKEIIGEPEAAGRYVDEMLAIKMKSFNAERFRYLLSKGFDLFNLHEQGLCLYKKTLRYHSVVYLSKDNKCKTVKVHRIVAEAFIDNPDIKPPGQDSRLIKQS